MKPKKVAGKPVQKKQSLFIKSLRLAKSNPGKAGLMILFDFLFAVSAFFAMPNLSSYLAKIIVDSQITLTPLIFIMFSSVYYLTVLLIYSFFKYSVLDLLKSLFEKTGFSYNRLWQFYALNIVIAGIFLAIVLVLNFILANMKQDFAPFAFIFFAIPFVLSLYAVINISHTLFYQGLSFLDSIKKGFEIAFTKIKFYREIVLFTILTALLLFAIFTGIGYLLNFIASKNYAMYLNLYGYFSRASVVVSDLALYFVVFINRISFYDVIRENK